MIMQLLVGGQPKREPKKSGDIASHYYSLGRRTAHLDQQSKENEQLSQLNMIQQSMVQQATLQLQQILGEVSMRQKQLDEQMQQTMGPPPLPVGPPPLPIDNGQPPEAGPTPGLVAPEGAPPPGVSQGNIDMGQPPEAGPTPDMGQPPGAAPPDQSGGIPINQLF